MRFNRRPTRLKNYDYNQNGCYFITICTKDMQCLLSKIVDVHPSRVGEGFHALPQVKLSDTGKIIENTIHFMNSAYEHIKITEYVIMPNHIHLIVSVNNPFDCLEGGRGSPPLQEFIKRLKTFTTKQYGQKLWQRGFHDHIIRDENDYLYHIQYIDENPKKWLMGKDKYYA